MPKFVNPNLAVPRRKGDQISDLIAPDKRVGKLVPIDEIAPNPNQPRKHFDEAALASLAESISQHGLINPITIDENGVILAGERRYRACQRLGFTEVPVVRMHGSMEISLVENLQRQDLHPLEEALGYQALADAGNTHEQIAQRIAKDRSVVSHSLRLLELPAEIQAESVTVQGVTKDQLLQVLAGKNDEERWTIWRAIREGKSARAIKRERAGAKGTHKAATPRVFINRVRSLKRTAREVDVDRATDKQRAALKASLEETITSLREMLSSLESDD